MASDPSIDVASILQPISEDNPTGSDVRDNPSPTSTYQTIKAERNAARAAERSSLHDGDMSEADEHWRKVAALAPKLLQEESKDLEVACWYTEAMVRKQSFHGLRDSFLIIHGLIEKFWDNLYPMPDEDGIETRVSAMSGLNGEGAEGVLIAPIRRVKITEGSSSGPYGYWEYQQALDLQKVTDEKTKASKAKTLGFSLSDIEKAVNESGQQFFVDMRDDIKEAIEIYRKTGALLDEHCGIHEAPPIKNITTVLEACVGAINHLAKHKFPVEVAEPESEQVEENAEQENGTPTVTQVQRGPVQTREAAFKQLTEIAEFFRKTEPHSPVSYVLEKAVKWGNMPLNELIQELIIDNTSRERFSELTGVSVEK